jgi:hypothetical protein
MSKTMGEMKYLNQDKVYIYQASLGLVDAHIIGILIQTDPQLTFHDNSKSSVIGIMRDNTPLSVLYKRVLELNPSSDNPHVTNDLAIMTGRYIRALWRKNSKKVTATFLQGF